MGASIQQGFMDYSIAGERVWTERETVIKGVSFSVGKYLQHGQAQNFSALSPIYI